MRQNRIFVQPDDANYKTITTILTALQDNRSIHSDERVTLINLAENYKRAAKNGDWVAQAQLDNFYKRFSSFSQQIEKKAESQGPLKVTSKRARGVSKPRRKTRYQAINKRDRRDSGVITANTVPPIDATLVELEIVLSDYESGSDME